MTILVGANNAGKTNIMSAINFLMGDRWPIPGNLLLEIQLDEYFPALVAKIIVAVFHRTPVPDDDAGDLHERYQ